MWRTWVARGVCAGVLALLVPVSAFAQPNQAPPPAPPPTEPPKAKPKPAVDPLVKPIADLFKRFLPQRPAETAPTVPASAPAGDAPAAKPDEKPKKPRHPADGRAPYDPQQAQWFSRAQGMIERGQWGQALDLLQRISDAPEDSLVQTPDGRWASLRLEVDRIRSTAPADMLKDYKVQFEQVAQDRLAQALASGQSEGLGRVTAAWFLTDSGVQAANALAAWHVDRGEFLLGARLYARLWETKARGTSDRQWKLRAAYALAKGGEVELARTIVGGGGPSIAVASTEVDLEKWLAEASQPIARPQPALEEWPAFFGGPRRNATFAGDEPLLLPRWNVPLTERQPARQRLQNLKEDLIDTMVPAVPQMSPVMIGGRIAFRTLHGIQVVDAATGKLLWQTENEIPIESAVTGQNVGAYDAWGNIRFGGRVFQGGMANYAGDGGESGALANLLFRNANFGLVSSDGQRLFVVEDPMILSGRMPGQGWWWWGDQGQQQSSANKLVSYDLETGRPGWATGGETNGEAFEPPLTGTFFFGPPLADRGELLIVGEKDNEVRLYALDPATGRPKWGQLIGLSESGIGMDVGRRWWTSQVACSEGIVVCLTTTGWVVAVDRATHSLIWGVPLFPPQPNENENNNPGMMEQQKTVMYAALNQRWANAPPVIIGDRVILTAPSTNPQNGGDRQALMCLQLGTGKTLWSKPRGEMVSLAGVFGDRVLAIHNRGLQAFALADGKDLWNRPLTADSPDAVPAGLGVAVKSHYYLPLSNGEVWSIGLEKGDVLSKAYTSEGALGNLTMYEGMLLSLGLDGMTAFEQRKSVESEIAKRKSADPNDPWALLREAEIHVLHRRHAESLELLRKIAPTQQVDIATRARELLVQSLTAEIRRTLAEPGAAPLLDELQALSKTPVEQRHHQRLLVDRLLATNQFATAFEALLALAKDPATEMVDVDDAVRVRSDLWVAGRMEDLFDALPEAEQPTISARVTELTQAALETSPEEQARFLRTFGWHPATHALRWKLVETYATAGEFLRTERILKQLHRGQDDAGLAKVLDRRAKLLEQFDLKPDAAALYVELSTRYPNSSEAVAAKAGGKLAPVEGTDTLNWKGRPARVERIGTNYYSNNYIQTLIGDAKLPFFRRYALEIAQQEQRLELTDTLTDKTLWSQPLRSRNGNDGSLATWELNAYQLAILHQGVLQMFSPVEKKVLWSLSSESRNTQQFYPGSMNNNLPAVQKKLSLNDRQTRRRPFGMTALSAANLEYVCRQERRSMTVHDALTGDVLWTADNIRPGTRCYGSEDRLYMMVPQAPVATATTTNTAGNVNIVGLAIRRLGGRVARTTRITGTPSKSMQLHLFRPSDGRKLEIPDLPLLVDNTFDIVEGDLILAETTAEAKTTKLRRFDPLAGVDRWTLETLPADAEFTLLDDADLAVLSRASGELSRVDLVTGARKVLGTIAPSELKKSTQIHLFADLDRVYAAVNSRNDGVFYYSYDGLQNLRISGTLHAFDSAAGKLAWEQKIDNNTMVLERIDHSPYLVFLTQQPKRNIVVLHVVVLEKTTGERLAEQDLSYSYSGMRNLTINATDAYVEVRGYQERVRVLAGKPPEKGSAPAPPK